ncbi:MAG: hypothetical protein QOK29_5219, partial [Rhodospirillaceae bacterium]|nr:hypothetical protein [Rhodospirillaceae bacterium]
GRGGEARSVRQLGTDAGLVVFVDLALDPGATLAEAHRLASEIEEDLRREQPAIADVVIHTEPLE